MGVTVNGARTFLTILQKACRLSHFPGFALGVNRILGPGAATDLLAVWGPVCDLVEGLIAADDYFNKRDATLPDSDGSEDGPFG